MKRPLADKRPLGPFAQSKTGTIHLYTTYNVDRDFGNRLESDSYRGNIEDDLEDAIERTSLREADVTLHPAGFVVGVQVDTNATQVESYLEDEMLGVLDREMEVQGNGRRPAEDEPEYEWQIR